MNYFDYPNQDEAMQLFGVDTIETPMTTNTLNLLTGQPGSICEGFVFDGSFQSPVWFIDKMTPNENGIAAFEEDNYGTVAVQGVGEYGQKTFCFSYALAKLRDMYDVKRDSLMTEIAIFFELMDPVDIEDEINSIISVLDLNIFPNPSDGISNIKYLIPVGSWQLAIGKKVDLSIFDIYGKKIRMLVDEMQKPGEYSVRFDGSDLPAGIYLVRLQAGTRIETTKLVVMR